MRVRLFLSVIAMTVLTAVGCSGAGNPDPPGEDSHNGTSGTDSPSQDPAVDAYIAMWEDTAVASETSDVNHPRLGNHASGNALTLLKFVIEGHATNGHVSQGRPKHDVTVVESQAGRRELQDCMDDTEWLMYEKKNGELVNDVPGSHGLVDATVELSEGRWIVTDLHLYGSATC